MADVHRLANRLAGAWPGRAGDRDLAAIASPNGPVFLAALLAARLLDLGLVLVDTGARAEERRRVSAALGVGTFLESTDGWRDWRWRETGVGRPAPPGADIVKLTSGSTGEPRGVLTPERALIADEDQLASTMGLREGDRFLATVPFSHSYGLVSLALPPLRRAGRVLLPDPSDPLGALRGFRDAPATIAPTVPAVLGGVVQRRGRLAQSLRLVVSAGAPLPTATALAFRERFGRPVHAFYGASECGGITFDRSGESALQGTLGTPVDGVQLTLSSDDAPGRVVVRAPSVASAYHPHASDELRDGRFLTADLGLLEGRELRLVGRVDEIINVKGKKVHPASIEAVLREAPQVGDVVVVAHRQGKETALRAVVAASDAGEVDRGALLRWCRLHLAEHKVPRSVVVVDRLPRNERGKIDRRALLEIASTADSA